MIDELFEYDKEIFIKNRNYYRKNYTLFESTIASLLAPVEDEIYTYEALVDQLENVNLVKALLSFDKVEQQIITLRLQGYIFHEISDILNININTLYSKYKRIQKILRGAMSR